VGSGVIGTAPEPSELTRVRGFRGVTGELRVPGLPVRVGD